MAKRPESKFFTTTMPRKVLPSVGCCFIPQPPSRNAWAFSGLAPLVDPTFFPYSASASLLQFTCVRTYIRTYVRKFVESLQLVFFLEDPGNQKTNFQTHVIGGGREVCNVPRQKAWAEEALKLVAADPGVIDMADYKYMTPLMLACAQGLPGPKQFL